MSSRNILVAFLILVIPFVASAQSKLKQSKTDVREGYAGSHSVQQTGQTYGEPTHAAPNGSSVWDFDDSDNFFASLAAAVVVSVTYYTAIGYYGGEYHLYNNLSKYPFCDKEAGNYSPKIESSEAVKPWRIDVRNSVLIGFDNVYGNHLELKLRPIKYVFLSTSYRQLVEKYKGDTEYLTLFNFSLNYDRLRFRNLNLGYSLGCNYLANEVKEASFALGFNFEAFALKHFSLLGDFNWGTRSGATLKTFELDASYHIKRYKISCGYEFMQIGKPMYNFLTVGVGVYL